MWVGILTPWGPECFILDRQPLPAVNVKRWGHSSIIFFVRVCKLSLLREISELGMLHVPRAIVHVRPVNISCQFYFTRTRITPRVLVVKRTCSVKTAKGEKKKTQLDQTGDNTAIHHSAPETPCPSTVTARHAGSHKHTELWYTEYSCAVQ